MTFLLTGCNIMPSHHDESMHEYEESQQGREEANLCNNDNETDEPTQAYGTFSYTVPDCQRFNKIPAVTVNELADFLETYFGFNDTVNYSAFERVNTEESEEDGDYSVYYLNQQGQSIGWNFTHFDDKITSMTYNLPPDFSQAFNIAIRVGDDIDSNPDIAYIELNANDDRVSVSFGEAYVKSVLVTGAAGASGEQALFYADGSIKSYEKLTDDTVVSAVGYYENGKTKHEFFYDGEGLLDGIITYYYDNGNYQSITQFEHGLRNGSHQTYNEDGSLKQESFYIADVLQTD